MSVRRSGLTPALIGILALVVLAQAAVLFLLLAVPPENDPILGPLRESRLITRVIEICRPVTG